MKRWIAPLAAAGLAVGLLAATGAAQAATLTKPGLKAPAATRPVPGKRAPASHAVPGISAGSLGDYSVQSAVFTAGTGGQTFGSVGCPAGTDVLGGGVFISGSDLTDNVNSSYPDGLAVWGGYVNNNSGVSTSFTVYAECALAPAGYMQVSSGPVDNPAGEQSVGIIATCPAGDKVLGGGGFNLSTSVAVNLNSSFPTKSTHPTIYHWRIDANNGSAADNTATAYAICGKKISGYKLVFPKKPITNPAFTETGAFKACPVLPAGQTVPTGGGVFSSSGSTAVNINSTLPGGGWGVDENNGSGSAATITPYAVCAL